jgi:hypothetical protein
MEGHEVPKLREQIHERLAPSHPNVAMGSFRE